MLVVGERLYSNPRAIRAIRTKLLQSSCLHRGGIKRVVAEVMTLLATGSLE